MSQLQQSINKKLGEKELRKNFRRITDGIAIQSKTKIKDIDQFQLKNHNHKDYFSRLKDWGYETKKNILERLPELLERLEKNCIKNGMEVHYANDALEANQIIDEILSSNQAKLVIKGKSMISEEIHLNHFLINRGYEVVETDLGEYILQLDNDTPSHIVAPAIHKVAADFSTLLKEKFPDQYMGEKDEEITATVRKILRKTYMEADVGISGVNFAVANTGGLVLVENEGNGRLTTGIPPIHIAIMSMEKVVNDFSEIPNFLKLLTVSATGQLITNYINIIHSPKKPEEKDGPQQVHLIILDNGRSKILEDEILRKTLYCIRCGACMNNCPVYSNITGHAYQTEIPGPIGKILMPQIRGLDKKGELPGMSSLCGACQEVCPVRIPIPKILLQLRSQNVDEKKNHNRNIFSSETWKIYIENKLWNGWSLVYGSNRNYQLIRKLLSKFRFIILLIFPCLPMVGKWSRGRKVPRIAKITLRELMKKNGNIF